MPRSTGTTLRRRSRGGFLMLSVILTGCLGGSPAPTPTGPAGTGMGRSPAVVPGGTLEGPSTSTCVQGWYALHPDSALYRTPMTVIRRTMGVGGPFVVVEMRYFQGPESPLVRKDYLSVVERWYVKAYLKRQPAIRGRWLVEQRTFGAGLAAVAPFDSEGFRSPDWIGFQYEAAHSERRRYPGLPGAWAGTPYDFVNGGADLTIMGLPLTVAGCLEGT